jgi:hypothetical protein
VLRADEWQTPLVGLLADEIMHDEIGQDAVLARLLDRSWSPRYGHTSPARRPTRLAACR